MLLNLNSMQEIDYYQGYCIMYAGMGHLGVDDNIPEKSNDLFTLTGPS